MKMISMALAGMMLMTGVASATVLSENKHASPYLRDGQFDEFVFGSEAAEVRVIDISNNSEVFRGQSTGSALKWDCRSVAGSLVQSGVYMAQIKDKDGHIFNQALVVVR